jgi:muconolactone delta-isomerase
MLGLSILCVSCDKEGNNDVPEQPKGAYIISATSEDGSYLVQAEDIASGQVSIIGNGLEAESGSAWVFYNDQYVYRLFYRQGDPAQASAYELDANGKLKVRANTFQLPSRYTTYGVFDKYIVTAVAVTQTDDTPGLQFNFLNVNDQSLTTKTIAGGNFTGNCETANLSGILEVGDKFFSGVCTTPAVNAGGSTGTLTEYPDSVWVAIFDKDLNCIIARDGRLSYSTGRYRSGYHTNLAKDDKDNVYVFSSAYDNRTTKPSGALRIKNGETRFDPDYFFDIQTLANGRHLFKVWHITGDYFLLQMYNTPNQTAEAVWGVLAVVDVVKKMYREVTGLPALDKISSIGSTPYTENGKIAIPVVSTDAYPHVYIIDPATASAIKGLEIVAEGAGAVGKLIKN